MATTAKKTFNIQSWNVNGIRACIKKGFWQWFDKSKADVVCLQEAKITAKDFAKIVEEYDLTPLVQNDSQLQLDIPKKKKRKKPLYYALASAKKPGYSGVLLLTKIKPKKVEIGLGKKDFDNEGRTIIAHFDNFILFNCYFPNGGRDLERVPYKLKYSDFLLKVSQKYRKTQKNIIITGDFNVAHEEVDIKNPKSNAKNSGFTMIERQWFTKLLTKKYIDSFREFNPNKRDVYTWWSYRPGVRQRNVGWRIDYFVTTSEMKARLKSSSINMKQAGSDHCPIGLIINP